MLYCGSNKKNKRKKYPSHIELFDIVIKPDLVGQPWNFLTQLLA
jgi:hypothetical protein